MQPLQSRLLLNWKRKRCVLSLPARILCTWVCSKLLSFVPGNPVLSCRCFAAHGGTVAEPNAEPDPVRDSNAKSKCNTDTDTKLNALAVTLGHIVNLNFGHRLAVVLANSVCDLITYSFEHSNE